MDYPSAGTRNPADFWGEDDFMTGASFLGISYLISLGITLGAIVFIIVLTWRFMRAHEKIAQSLSDISQYIKSRKED